MHGMQEKFVFISQIEYLFILSITLAHPRCARPPGAFGFCLQIRYNIISLLSFFAQSLANPPSLPYDKFDTRSGNLFTRNGAGSGVAAQCPLQNRSRRAECARLAPHQRRPGAAEGGPAPPGWRDCRAPAAAFAKSRGQKDRLSAAPRLLRQRSSAGRAPPRARAHFSAAPPTARGRRRKR